MASVTAALSALPGILASDFVAAVAAETRIDLQVGVDRRTLRVVVGVPDEVRGQLVKAYIVLAPAVIGDDDNQPTVSISDAVVFEGSAETLRLCEDKGLASVNRSPLGQGLLTGKFDAATYTQTGSSDGGTISGRWTSRRTLLTPTCGGMRVCGFRQENNATGVRVREYPITVEKIIAGLPPSSPRA